MGFKISSVFVYTMRTITYFSFFVEHYNSFRSYIPDDRFFFFEFFSPEIYSRIDFIFRKDLKKKNSVNSQYSLKICNSLGSLQHGNHLKIMFHTKSILPPTLPLCVANFWQHKKLCWHKRLAKFIVRVWAD